MEKYFVYETVKFQFHDPSVLDLLHRYVPLLSCHLSPSSLNDNGTHLKVNIDKKL